MKITTGHNWSTIGEIESGEFFDVGGFGLYIATSDVKEKPDGGEARLIVHAETGNARWEDTSFKCLKVRVEVKCSPNKGENDMVETLREKLHNVVKYRQNRGEDDMIKNNRERMYREAEYRSNIGGDNMVEMSRDMVRIETAMGQTVFYDGDYYEVLGKYRETPHVGGEFDATRIMRLSDLREEDVASNELCQVVGRK